MNNLYISLFKSPRHDEFMECLKKNMEIFDRVYVLNEGCEHTAIDLPVSCRPTFRTFFKAINHITGDNDVNVIANSDIYFESIVGPKNGQCYALTRWEGERFLNRADSQDSWIFKGPVLTPKYCDFGLGIPGCDNRIAHELRMEGYEVLNPSLTIITRHIHKEPTQHSYTKRVAQPYFKPIPCHIS